MPALSALVAGAVLVLATVLVPTEVGRTDAAASGDVTRVTGAVTFPIEGSGGAGTFDDHALQWRGVDVCALLSTNDARLTGDVLLNWNSDVFLPDYIRETSGAIATAAVVVRNDGGSWEGVWRGLTYPDRAGGQHHILLTGSGPYEGHAALLYLTVVEAELLVDGLVFPGEAPPVPEPPEA